MKVAIIGSRMYENTRKIKDTLFQLKQKFAGKLIVISGGAKNGADRFARKYALEFGIKYKEFNPAHTTKNLYSAMSEDYYEKPYHVSQFHHRNMLIAKDCDVMLVFIPTGENSSGSMSAVKQAKKLKKPVTIVS
jgi:predicted Rossmann fold nucleotide-binding protein DprA/Smf involved in DNA uptake